ncbi:cysteine synthase A [Desulfohalotomaculum tongense]|uniref:cysteine synthase A n=1 Tax=Desulforadius tongensis TaxID=1216062 RepID=UPI0023683A1A|nr:cysteine synthase A [Desulforadius tongensis]MBM7855036.1 cysteine synthase A [Desulforadius tongensis]
MSNNTKDKCYKSSKILSNILEAVGGTPMIRLSRVVEDCPASILAKVEFLNPSGSAKARTALGMILDAERKGIINSKSVIVEPTSGNQGIALAMVGAVRGYRTIIVMPETMSIERRKLIQAYGAEVVLTPAAEDVNGAIKKAQEIAKSIPNAWMPNQFENAANPLFHQQTTAMEILDQLDGPIDAFVAGVGTGGTISGVAGILKKHFPKMKVYAVEPANSAVIAGHSPGEHKIQGIGDGFVPKNLDLDILDAPISVSDEDAIYTARKLAREEGLLVGISSGAAVWAACQVGKQLGAGKKVLTLLVDTGERYLSTDLFSE